MSAYTRQLTFRAANLGKAATLVLTFDSDGGLYQDKFPVIWKSFHFSQFGLFTANVTYANNLAVSKPQVDHGATIVHSAAFQRLHYGQQTTLTKDNGIYGFTPPEALTAVDSLKVSNGTQSKEDISLGFLSEGSIVPTPVYYWDALEAGASIQTQFSPVLRAYVTNEYQEGQIIRGQINSPVIFEKDLSQLGNNTTLVLLFNPVTGEFSISLGF